MSKTIAPLCSAAVIALLLGGLGAQVTAEQVRIPLGQQDNAADWGSNMPVRGWTKGQIRDAYGAPDSQDGPTGDPPIYFWEYPDFTVYFEGNHVIHAVSKRISTR